VSFQLSARTDEAHNRCHINGNDVVVAAYACLQKCTKNEYDTISP